MTINRVPISFRFFCLANCERDIRATTCGNLRRQRAQERVHICFTNGVRTARARRAAINANVILWHDQMIFRYRERPRRDVQLGKQRATFLPTWQQFFFAGHEKTTGVNINRPLDLLFIWPLFPGWTSTRTFVHRYVDRFEQIAGSKRNRCSLEIRKNMSDRWWMILRLNLNFFRDRKESCLWHCLNPFLTKTIGLEGSKGKLRTSDKFQVV